MNKSNSGKISIKFDTDSIRCIGLFESQTGVTVKDCMINGNKITFVVKEGQAGMAIGKNGSNVKNLQDMLKKKVEIIEFNNDPLTFISNLLRPLNIANAYTSESSDSRKIIKLTLGGSGSKSSKVKVNLTLRPKLKKAKYLVKKYYNIDDIIIS